LTSQFFYPNNEVAIRIAKNINAIDTTFLKTKVIFSDLFWSSREMPILLEKVEKFPESLQIF
jgi:hypothetical protein